MHFHDLGRHQATPAAQRRLAERSYTRDAIPTIDDGVHVHVHPSYDQAPDECEGLADRIELLERAVATLC